jgi:signal transduction histidine kinase
MTHSLLVLAVAALLAVGIVAPGHGAGPALVTAAVIAGLGMPALVGAHALAARRRFASLRRQFALSAAVVVGVILISVLAASQLMFVSGHDALLVSAIVLAAGLVALRVGDLVAGGVARDVGTMSVVLEAVGRGERDLRLRSTARDEIGALARAADSMTEQLAEGEHARDASEQSRRHLVAAVSHDLRTPIAALRLQVEAIEDELVDEATRRRYLAVMRTHIDSLSAMIDDLFELSRIEAGQIEWSMRQVELAMLVDEAVTALRPEARAHRVHVRSELDDAGLSAHADPEKIQRVLFNLIRNAVRHTPADGSVTVRAKAGPGTVQIEVADTGHGIAAEDRAHVFEPFYRGARETARDSEGTGLGLAICRAIVETHGGRIWIGPSQEGTRVRFSLPNAPGPTASSRRSQLTYTERTTSASRG